jgi:hypothetical protein
MRLKGLYTICQDPDKKIKDQKLKSKSTDKNAKIDYGDVLDYNDLVDRFFAEFTLN